MWLATAVRTLGIDNQPEGDAGLFDGLSERDQHRAGDLHPGV
jgi:hypothetical protein